MYTSQRDISIIKNLILSLLSPIYASLLPFSSLSIIIISSSLSTHVMVNLYYILSEHITMYDSL